VAKFLNTILNEILVSLENDYNVYEVFDKEDANVVLNDVQESDFPIAFFSIKNNGSVTHTRHKKSYPVYDVAVWLLKLYEEDNKTELETNYEQLRLDALEFEQRLQRTEEFAKVPTNTVLSPNHEEFDADLDLLATALQISFSISIDLGEDTSRVCVPLNVSSFTVDDSDLDAVVLDASASSFRGVALGATDGRHSWVFVMNETTVSISGLSSESLSNEDIALLESIGIDSPTGNYNSFNFSKNSSFDGSLNFNISVSHTYDYREKGAISDATTGEVSRRVFVFLNTNWDTSTEGDWDPIFTTSSGVCTLKVGNDEYVSNTPAVDSDYLDGTEKQVILIAPSNDYNLITSITASNKKLTGICDITPLPSFCLINFGDTTSASPLNNTITSIITSEDGVGQLYARKYLGTEITIKVNGGGLWLSNSENLNSLSILPGSSTSDFSASNMNSLSNIDLSNLQHSGGRFDISTNIDVNTILKLNTTDLSNVSNIDFAGRILNQDVDLGNYTMSGFLDLTDCEITSIEAPLGVISSPSNVRGNRFTDVTLPTVNATVLGGDAGDLLENLTITSGTLAGLIRFSGGVLKTVDLGSAVISSVTTEIDFSDNSMNTSEVDNVWVELDRVAVFTASAVTLNVNGDNDPPSVGSESERLNLFFNGYILIE
jgi:hypothetical protein